MADCNNLFKYSDERFADLQMLRYQLGGFEKLSLKTKKYIYCLSKATIYGRDITFDQNGKYNLLVRKTLEYVYENYSGNRNNEDFKAMTIYLKRVWFSSGIYHHYGCEKFTPDFSESFLREQIAALPDDIVKQLSQTTEQFADVVCKVIFDADFMPKRVNQSADEDLVKTSACNFYDNVSQSEAETYYNEKKEAYAKEHPDKKDCQPSWGLNSRLTKDNAGRPTEQVWKENGLYGNAIKQITFWLEKAVGYAENDLQKDIIRQLVKYYRSGDLTDFDEYSIKWVGENSGTVDFINGFIEVYGDPLGLKGTWEGIVEYTDAVASKRTKLISENAQWFEDNSPVDKKFKKEKVKGVSARVINAAMLGGDEYPASAIGINLPNANWIRSEYGSKSVTIGNLTHSYDEAAKGNGFRDEFVIDSNTVQLLDKYAALTDDLHTDLHECLGHGSGKLLPGTDPDALKAYGNTIEEARADLFGLYYIADDKLIELGLLPDREAYKAQYYSYLMNGLLTQTMRISLGNNIEEAHMRNRALIAWWAVDLSNSSHTVEIIEKAGKHYVKINDYAALRNVFAKELAEIQRIKSEGDYDKAKYLVEKYAVKINPALHKEVLDRYATLNIAPYKGFINPRLELIKDNNGNITDIKPDYTESFASQNIRYSHDYATI